MPPTPEQTQAGYHKLWNSAELRPDKKEPAKAIAQKILANRGKYEAVQTRTGVPWFMIGALHNRESSLNFRCVLHNGERIVGTGQKTRLVPKGRGPFPTWEAAAVDALATKPHSLQNVKYWSVERALYEIERFNGWGYLGKGNSPYVWSWTSEYHGGKYIRDHVFDPNAWDGQAGCAAILKELARTDPIVAAWAGNRQPTPPKDVIGKATKDATKSERAVRNTGAAIGTGSAGGKAATEAPNPTTQPGAHIAHAWFLPTAAMLGFVIVIVAVVLIAKKGRDIKAHIAEKWS